MCVPWSVFDRRCGVREECKRQRQHITSQIVRINKNTRERFCFCSFVGLIVGHAHTRLPPAGLSATLSVCLRLLIAHAHALLICSKAKLLLHKLSPAHSNTMRLGFGLLVVEAGLSTRVAFVCGSDTSGQTSAWCSAAPTLAR